jgi:membrane protease YdiL (CAAX protease family)
MQKYHRKKIRIYVFYSILVFLLYYFGHILTIYFSAKLSGEIIFKINPEITKNLLKSQMMSISTISANIVDLIIVIGFGQLFFGKLLYRRGAVKPSWSICKKDDCVLGFRIGAYIAIFSVIIIVLRYPSSSSKEVVFENNLEIFAFVFSSLIVSIVEELLFRGLLYGAIRSILGAAPSFLIITFSFVFLHYLDHSITIYNFLPLIALAIGALWIRLKSDSVIPAIILHFVYNAFVTAVYLISVKVR